MIASGEGRRFLRTNLGSARQNDALAALEDLAWKDATGRNTRQAYEQFAQLYPSGRQVNEIGNAVDSLEWEEARRTDTDVANRSYLRKHPDGAYAAKATERTGDRLWAELERLSRFDEIVAFVARVPSRSVERRTTASTSPPIRAGDSRVSPERPSRRARRRR